MHILVIAHLDPHLWIFFADLAVSCMYILVVAYLHSPLLFADLAVSCFYILVVADLAIPC